MVVPRLARKAVGKRQMSTVLKIRNNSPRIFFLNMLNKFLGVPKIKNIPFLKGDPISIVIPDDTIFIFTVFYSFSTTLHPFRLYAKTLEIPNCLA